VNFIPESDEKPSLSDYLIIARKNKEGDAFFFRAENFFNLEKYGGLYPQYTGSSKTFREMSHGQGFKAFFQNRMRKNGLYFFDDPESALSPGSQIEFLFLIKEFEKMDSQILITTHSPILLSYPAAQIFLIENDTIKEIDYEQTPSFKETKSFLEHYKRFQKELRTEK